MALTILYIFIIYIIGGFLIGKPMGKKSLEIWRKGKEIENWNGGIWGLLLFPLSSMTKSVGNKSSTEPYVEDYVDKTNDKIKKYLAINFIFWPARLIFNIIGVIYCLFDLFCQSVLNLVKKMM